MLSTWEGHATVDPARIGMFGFSADGFTTLVSIGAAPDYRVLPDAGHFDFLVPCSPAALLWRRSRRPFAPVPSASIGRRFTQVSTLP